MVHFNKHLAKTSTMKGANDQINLVLLAYKFLKMITAHEPDIIELDQNWIINRVGLKGSDAEYSDKKRQTFN